MAPLAENWIVDNGMGRKEATVLHYGFPDRPETAPKSYSGNQIIIGKHFVDDKCFNWNSINSKIITRICIFARFKNHNHFYLPQIIVKIQLKA